MICIILFNINNIKIKMCSEVEINIEDLDKKFNAIINGQRRYEKPTLKDIEMCRPFFENLLTNEKYHKKLQNLKIQHSLQYKKNSFIFEVYKLMIVSGLLNENKEKIEYIRKIFKIKKGKSHSGIISITIFTSATPSYFDSEQNKQVTQNFSCKWNCAYCPNEPGQPRSYLKGEPGVLRANQNAFICKEQMWDRMNCLYAIGHDIDKLEVLVLGGTWESYPEQYRYEFIRDIYYAANVFWETSEARRQPLSLEEEKAINKYAVCKVIGLTLETRPDTITPAAIKLFRYYGCTRIQLGIQHIHNDVLEKINRQCTTEQTIKAIRMLKDCGYKIDGHWMPNLPGSTLQKDDEMLNNQLLGVVSKSYTIAGLSSKFYHIEQYKLRNPDLQLDQWKVYPCTIVPFTEIEKWYKEGIYIPYQDDELSNMLLKMKTLIFPWIRINRIIRDIPKDYVFTTEYNSNMRQNLTSILEKEMYKCNCIRCREVKTVDSFDVSKIKLVVRKYNASDGDEYFISFEDETLKTLYGFVRLRLTKYPRSDIFPELAGAAMIRELHVYGDVNLTTKNEGKSSYFSTTTKVQHQGLGKSLLRHAQDISKHYGYNKISVIPGEGTRGYYEKSGYSTIEGEGFYMMKNI